MQTQPATDRRVEEGATRIEWRLYSHRTTERWTSVEYAPMAGDRPDHGLPLPDGARIHSILPTPEEWVVWFLVPHEVPA